MRRVTSAIAAALLIAAMSIGVGNAGVKNCTPSWKCASPAPTVLVTPRPTPTLTPTVAPTVQPTVAPTASPYTFQDEFLGTTINTSKWGHGTMDCCGTGLVDDPSMAYVSDGYLHFKVESRSDGWHGYLLDTYSRFSQKYGYFEARIKFPQGRGFWPAFWMWQGPGSTNEIDVMEVCANPPGTNGGNDATMLHTYVHFADGTQRGQDLRTGTNLSTDWHTYSVDWRAGSLKWYLDGNLVFTYTGSNVPAITQHVLVNLGVGGSWCGSPDSTSPSPSEMLVDWVRVRP